MSKIETSVPTKVHNLLPPATPEVDALRRRLLDVLFTPTRLRMSYEEFLDWADEDTLAEWVNGEVIMTSPASNKHQDISGFLESVLRIYVETKELGCVRTAPFQMKLKNGREPDIVFVAKAHLDRLKETYLDGPADLAVEIVSPESVGRDRGEKFYEYAEGGVPEYWLIDPLTEHVELYRLAGDRYQTAFSGHSGRYDALVIPGFWLQVEWLWQEPLPNPLRLLGEIVGMDAGLLERFLGALRQTPGTSDREGDM